MRRGTPIAIAAAAVETTAIAKSAEQNDDDAIRANLLKLVRAWLAAANELEKAASKVLAEISARP